MRRGLFIALGLTAIALASAPIVKGRAVRATRSILEWSNGHPGDGDLLAGHLEDYQFWNAGSTTELIHGPDHLTLDFEVARLEEVIPGEGEHGFMCLAIGPRRGVGDPSLHLLVLEPDEVTRIEIPRPAAGAVRGASREPGLIRIDFDVEGGPMADAWTWPWMRWVKPPPGIYGVVLESRDEGRTWRAWRK